MRRRHHTFHFSVFTFHFNNTGCPAGQPVLLVLLLFVREVAALDIVDVVAYGFGDCSA